jgi:transcriptional regulator with XRE-family HTH domain
MLNQPEPPQGDWQRTLNDLGQVARSFWPKVEAAREAANTDDPVDEVEDAVSRQVNARIRRIVAERLLKARELNGYAQVEAAGLFGYRNSSQLSQWETGKRMPPLKELIRASEVYQVSVDYLLGLSAEPDRDPRKARSAAAVRALRAVLDDAAVRIAAQVDGLSELAGPGAEVVGQLVAKAAGLGDAVSAFVRRNAAVFDELPAGASLLHAHDELDKSMPAARDLLRRFDRAGREPEARPAREGVEAWRKGGLTGPLTRKAKAALDSSAAISSSSENAALVGVGRNRT